VRVTNTGATAATDVVLAFEVVEGGEFFHEAEFGNGQLWWAHGAPDAGIIYFVPEVRAGESAGVRFVATMQPSAEGAEWGGDARTVIRVSVVGAECAEPSTDEALLTFSATEAGSATANAPTVATPNITATPVRTPTGVSTVLGVEQAPTGAAQPTGTAPSGEIQPDDGDGASDSAAAAALVLAGVAIALVFLVVGVAVGRVLPR
jgi:hypothetical protein